MNIAKVWPFFFSFEWRQTILVTLPETDFTLVIDEEKGNDGKKLFLKLLVREISQFCVI